MAIAEEAGAIIIKRPKKSSLREQNHSARLCTKLLASTNSSSIEFNSQKLRDDGITRLYITESYLVLYTYYGTGQGINDIPKK